MTPVYLNGTDLIASILGGMRHAVPILKFAISPTRALGRRVAAMEAERQARRARVEACTAYMRRRPVRIGDRRVEHDDVARILARLYDGEVREVFALVAKSPSGMRLLYCVGRLADVEVNVTGLRSWLRQHEVTAAWAAHCHVRLPDDDGDSDLDDPSVADERLDRLLRRIRPIRDTMVVDAESCTRSDEVRFYSFSEGRSCSCSPDRETDDEIFARAARSRRRA